MSINQELQRIDQAKADIKEAIENKGVEVGDGLIDTYAEKIDEISGGGYPEPTGTIEITENGEDIDVKDYASANVNVPQPEGTIEITENGEGIDVSAYASANVNVPTGGGGLPVNVLSKNVYNTGEAIAENTLVGVEPLTGGVYKGSYYYYMNDDAPAFEPVYMGNGKYALLYEGFVTSSSENTTTLYNVVTNIKGKPVSRKGLRGVALVSDIEIYPNGVLRLGDGTVVVGYNYYDEAEDEDKNFFATATLGQDDTLTLGTPVMVDDSNFSTFGGNDNQFMAGHAIYENVNGVIIKVRDYTASYYNYSPFVKLNNGIMLARGVGSKNLTLIDITQSDTEITVLNTLELSDMARKWDSVVLVKASDTAVFAIYSTDNNGTYKVVQLLISNNSVSVNSAFTFTAETLGFGSYFKLSSICGFAQADSDSIGLLVKLTNYDTSANPSIVASMYVEGFNAGLDYKLYDLKILGNSDSSNFGNSAMGDDTFITMTDNGFYASVTNKPFVRAYQNGDAIAGITYTGGLASDLGSIAVATPSL